MNLILSTSTALALVMAPTLMNPHEGCSSATRTAWTGDHAQKDIIDTAVEAGSFNTLATAIQTAGLVDALKGEGPFTVFAPTDEAFAQLPKEALAKLLRPEGREALTQILTYHVVSGRVPAEAVLGVESAGTLNGQRVSVNVQEGSVRIDGANVIKTDIECSNGIIHVIDRVLLPEQRDIVGVAVDAGFDTLVTAVKAAHLVETLQGEGPFTVFAPTNEAFAALPEGTVSSLLEEQNRDQLASVLTYHVVPGRIYGEDAIKAGSATTVQGHKIRFEFADGKLRVNGALVTSKDIQTKNGVIHVIDKVLLPQ